MHKLLKIAFSSQYKGTLSTLRVVIARAQLQAMKRAQGFPSLLAIGYGPCIPGWSSTYRVQTSDYFADSTTCISTKVPSSSVERMTYRFLRALEDCQRLQVLHMVGQITRPLQISSHYSYRSPNAEFMPISANHDEIGRMVFLAHACV